MTHLNRSSENKELWVEFDEAVLHHSTKWEWVKGYAGHTENEVADRLVNEGMEPYMGLPDMEF